MWRRIENEGNERMNDKVIGIIGGMGPEATAFYYTKLIKKTNAHRDQEHFRVIIDSNSKIPDRTEAILYQKESPIAEIYRCIDTLNLAKVDLGFVTCITSHYFIREMKQRAAFHLIDAIEELSSFIRKDYSHIQKIGILGTSGTKKTGLFNRYLKDFDLIYPNDSDQEQKVMPAIYSEEFGIKGGVSEGKCIDMLIEVGETLVQSGAEILITGCTEIGMIFKKLKFSVDLIDPMDCAIQVILKNP